MSRDQKVTTSTYLSLFSALKSLNFTTLSRYKFIILNSIYQQTSALEITLQPFISLSDILYPNDYKHTSNTPVQASSASSKNMHRALFERLYHQRHRRSDVRLGVLPDKGNFDLQRRITTNIQKWKTSIVFHFYAGGTGNSTDKSRHLHGMKSLVPTSVLYRLRHKSATLRISRIGLNVHLVTPSTRALNTTCRGSSSQYGSESILAF